MSGNYGGNWYPGRENKEKQDTPTPKGVPPSEKPAPSTEDALARMIYASLRHESHDLECLIASVSEAPEWTEKDLKRLDKAVTVMKVGFKILKKVLKSRERRFSAEAALTPEAGG